MKNYLIEVEWKIEDKRDLTGGWRNGVSSLYVKSKSKEDAINTAIDFCENIPSWEFDRNQINLEDYRESPKSCRYFYRTQITKVLRCKVVKDGECR